MVEELILSGADIIKVGIGPGEWVDCPRVLTLMSTQNFTGLTNLTQTLQADMKTQA